MTCLGIGIGPMIGGVVASKFGIRVPFALMGISALIGGAMVQRFLPENNKIPQQNGQ
jgi:MFS family permease